MTSTADPTDLPGDFEHTIADDGLSMTSLYTAPDGATVQSAMSWRSLDLAQARYESTRAGFERRVAEKWADEAAAMDGRRVRRRARRWRTRFGDLCVYVAAGEPFLAKPDPLWEVGTETWKIRVGLAWLRIAGTVGIRRQPQGGDPA